MLTQKGTNARTAGFGRCKFSPPLCTKINHSHDSVHVVILPRSVLSSALKSEVPHFAGMLTGESSYVAASPESQGH